MSLFGLFDKKEDNTSEIEAYLEKGALVLDVRTIEEYEEGHVPNSTHIQLDYVLDRVEEIKAFKKPIITVCRSGGRSGMAMEILQEHGVDVINGGPWGVVDEFLS